MRCTQNYRIYTVFSITIGLHRISTLEHVMSVSREVLLTCHSGGDSEIPCEGLKATEPEAGAGLGEVHLTLLFPSNWNYFQDFTLKSPNS